MALPKGLKYQIDLLANNKATASLNKFKRDVGGVNSAVAQLRNTIVAAFSGRELVQAANVMIGVKNRMDAFTGSAEETAKAMAHMKRIALESRSDFDAVAMLFTRLSLATEHLGATQDDVAKATQMVANTFIIAGSHAQEANNSARQLAQGLASGALRGDELRSVMENNTILTKMLADGLDMTVGELREFGHAGKLTAETVMPILIAGIDETNELIKEMPMTLGQAGVALRNSFQFMIGDIQESTGKFSQLASGIKKVADNLDVIFIPAIFAAVAAVKTLTIAIAANPIGALIIGLQAGVMAAYIFRNELMDIFKNFFQKTLPIAGKKMQIFAEEIKLAFGQKFIQPVKQAFNDFVNVIFSSVNKGITKVNNLIAELPQFIKDKFDVSEIPTIDLLPDPENNKAEIESKIATLVADIEKISNKVIEKSDIPNIMDIIFPTEDAPASDGKTGFTPLTRLQQFFKDAEKGYKDFITKIKTVQEEIQGVFKKTYDGLTQSIQDAVFEGKNSFKDLADTIIKEMYRIALQKIILDPLFNAFANLFPSSSSKGASDAAKALKSIPSGDGGGFTGFGARAGGVDGKGGFPAILHPNETVIDHTKGKSMSPNININISANDANGFDELLVKRKNLLVSIISQAMNQRGNTGLI
jgi:tape measure domain-containing protein